MNESPEPATHRGTENPNRLWIPVSFEEFCAATAMALICLISFANVLVRYFTDESFAFTEEFSVFLMVVLTFFGASAAFAKNVHIRVSFFVDRLKPRLAHMIELVIMLIALVLFAIIVWYGIKLFLDDWNYETTSPGIGIPQWIYTLWLPLLSGLISLRISGRIIRLLRNDSHRC